MVVFSTRIVCRLVAAHIFAGINVFGSLPTPHNRTYMYVTYMRIVVVCVTILRSVY